MEINHFTSSFFEGLKPEPILSVSEWADTYRMLSSKASPEPGAWRTTRTPYLKEIMDELSPSSRTQEVVFIAGAQVGKTETGLNWLGFIMSYAPGPVLAVQPTIDLGKRFSKQRIASMIEESPSIKAKVSDTKSRDSSNTMMSKDFTGGVLVVAGANAAAGLRSMPAKYIFLDEIDAYPDDLDGEGDPVDLATARTRTFGTKKKILKTSTPTLESTSKIARAFEASDQNHFHVPCPHCGQYQTLKFSNLIYENNDAASVYLRCEITGCRIDEFEKTKMLAAGRWIAANPGAGRGLVKGYKLNSLYSPLGWLGWPEIVDQWLKAQGNQEKLRTFVNTILGETWKSKGDAPEWRRLYERREPYALNSIPQGVYFLTMGVDVQADRLECHVIGWGRDRESWPIDYRIIEGKTDDVSKNGPWFELEKLLREQWTTPSGQSIGIRLTAIDSGYLTQVVYDFVRKFPSQRVIATKGQDGLSVTVGMPSAADVTVAGKKIRRGLRVWPVGSSHIKSETYSVLKLEKPTEEEFEAGELYPPGFVHFPEFGEDYFKQLCAEELQITIHKGFRKYTWVKIYERNEVLDTFVYARAAAAVVGIDRFTDAHWEAVLNDLGPAVTRESLAHPEREAEQTAAVHRPAVVQNSAPKKPGGIPRRKSSFL